MVERYKLIVEAYLLLRKGDEILLLRRFNTGYEDGNYSLIAGHLEETESVRSAVIRESQEEVGITLKEGNLDLAHVMHRKPSDGRLALAMFFVADSWGGEPENHEPQKCDDLSWFHSERLPENTIPYIRQAIGCVQAGEMYSEEGWS